MSLKIGITGASGVLGSELQKKIKKNLIIFKGDLTKKKDVYHWIKNNEFKSIYHFAAVVPIKDFNKSVKKSFKVNSTGTKFLVDAIIKFQSKKIWFFYSSTSHVYKLNKFLTDWFELHQLTLLSISFCPHHDAIESCICRKPDSLMLEKVIARYNISVNDSFLIGDSLRDIKAAEKVGLKAFQIKPNSNLNLLNF